VSLPAAALVSGHHCMCVCRLCWSATPLASWLIQGQLQQASQHLHHAPQLLSTSRYCVHQVCISYGPKPSGELLLCYGFHPPPGSNPHESVSLALQLAREDPQYKAKAAALTAR
jgi:hypothetical protein